MSWTACEKKKETAMAMSLSADDEDYDSDSEQVSTPNPCRQAGRPPEECLCQTEQCAASQGSEGTELPGEKCIDSVLASVLGVCFLPIFFFVKKRFAVCLCACMCVFFR